nr:SH3 domain-containing protein [Mesorhizobium sp.]
MRLASIARFLVVALPILLWHSAGHADYVAGLDPHGDNFLALRAGPDTSFRTIRRLGPDTILVVLARRGQWLRVRMEDGTEGWAFGRYVAPGLPPGYDEAPEDEAGWEEDGPVLNGKESEAAEATPPPEEPADIPAQEVTAEDWRTYSNARIGTTIEYPAAFFRMEPPPENDDGRSFATRDGRTRFTVSGSHNVFEKTIPELMADDIAAAEGDMITYRRSGDDWYVLSGYRDGDVFYRKILLSEDGATVHTFEIAYVKALKAEFEEITIRMAKSLSAGGKSSLAAEATEDKTGAQPEAEPETAELPDEATADTGAAVGAPTQDSWRSPLEEVLFTGEQTGLFLPHQANGGVFDKHARYEDGELVVDVPEGNGWGKAGVLTNDPLIWLDDFRDDAEVRVTFTLDPGKTTGFAVALAQPGWGGVRGNDPGFPGVRFYWIREKDGMSARTDFHVDPHRDGDFFSAAVAPDSPGTVTFILKPGRASVEMDGVKIAEREAPDVSNGSGYRIYAFSHPADVNLPAKMALKDIRVTRTYATVPSKTGPAVGVEPLPTETVFVGKPDNLFEPAAIAGGDFDRFARWGDGALVIDVPEGHSWGKTGLISAKPLVVLDERVFSTPTRLTLTVDPRRTTRFALALAADKLAEMWLGHQAWFSVGRLKGEPAYELFLHHSSYSQWSRKVPAAWMDDYWDGTLEFDIGLNHACMRVPQGPAVCGQISASPGNALYASIQAHAELENFATSLALNAITRGLVTPVGMTALARWNLLPKDAFDADTYLEDLAVAAPWPEP